MYAGQGVQGLPRTLPGLGHFAIITDGVSTLI
jgi:hypothetical protein